MGAALRIVPAGISLSLARLPRGWQALAGSAIAVVAVQLLWRVDVPEGAGGPLAAPLTQVKIAMVMAAIVQGLRTLPAPDAPRWAHPAIVALGSPAAPS
jgi:hypothetical protein